MYCPPTEWFRIVIGAVWAWLLSHTPPHHVAPRKCPPTGRHCYNTCLRGFLWPFLFFAAEAADVADAAADDAADAAADDAADAATAADAAAAEAAAATATATVHNC